MPLQCWTRPEPQHTSTCETDLWNTDKKERTVWAWCFLPAKKHSVLSCSDSHTSIWICQFSPSHSLTMSRFSLPAWLWQVGKEVGNQQKEIYLCGVWSGAESTAEVSVCQGRKHLTVPEPFKSRKSVTSPLKEAQKPTMLQNAWRAPPDTECNSLPSSLVLYADWWSHRLEQNVTHEATGELPKNTRLEESSDSIVKWAPCTLKAKTRHNVSRNDCNGEFLHPYLYQCVRCREIPAQVSGVYSCQLNVFSK